MADKMTPRERWNRTMHFKGVDRVPNYEFGYWKETLERWHKEGLPEYVNSHDEGHKFFGLDPAGDSGVNVGMLPGFELKVLEEDERHKIIIDKDGAKKEIHKDGASSIPHFLEFPLKDRKGWEEFKKRLDPDTPGRYPKDWEERKKSWQKRNYPLSISAGSLFGKLRNWMGFENIAVKFYDDPKLMHDMIEHMTYLVINTIEKALSEVDFDYATMWEDMAFNYGPMVSPSIFREFLVPRYKKITSLLNKYGIDVVLIDCDGNINDIVEPWLDAGVNCMFPLEVNSGSDPVELRKKFGKRVLLKGGVDKMKLAEGKKAIDQEIKRLEKVVEEGGYIPHVDHRCPPDVSYENYIYYLQVKKKAFGIE